MIVSYDEDAEGSWFEKYLACSMPTDSTPAGKIPAENICISFVYRGSDMVELRYKCVFEPVNEHL